MATPQVTGAAALAAAVYPGLEFPGIWDRILAGSAPKASLQGRVATVGLLNLNGLIMEPARDGDADGVPDFRDNCPATANPDQTDAGRDGCGNTCDAALNNDDQVNQQDFMIFRNAWGGTDAVADLNSDGVRFRRYWGRRAPFE